MELNEEVLAELKAELTVPEKDEPITDPSLILLYVQGSHIGGIGVDDQKLSVRVEVAGAVLNLQFPAKFHSDDPLFKFLQSHFKGSAYGEEVMEEDKVWWNDPSENDILSMTYEPEFDVTWTPFSFWGHTGGMMWGYNFDLGDAYPFVSALLGIK